MIWASGCARAWPLFSITITLAVGFTQFFASSIEKYCAVLCTSAGAASITELNDAQDAALTAELAAAQARYQFIINFVRVLRGVGSFDILLLPGGLEEWYAQLSEYFVSAGVATR